MGASGKYKKSFPGSLKSLLQSFRNSGRIVVSRWYCDVGVASKVYGLGLGYWEIKVE